MIKRILIEDYEFTMNSIKDSKWISVTTGGKQSALLTNEEEARRYIWLELGKLGIDIEFIDDDMFEELEDEICI